MSLILHALSAYASYKREVINWRAIDYDINKFVKALKHKEFRGAGGLTDMHGTRLQFDKSNPDNALIIFGCWGVRRLRRLNLGDVVLVPVPSSKCVEFGLDSAPQRMARALRTIGQRDEISVEPWLRFRHAMPSASSDGGTRNVNVLRDSLVVSSAVKRKKVVLIDDVKTTGSHLRACAQVLRENGVEVKTVLVAASTVWEQHPHPLGLDPEDLERRG
ncbi:ComF family protein [Massilia soli]|uniref:Phosphoribosyltransferase domain-containing protein n=1 Tax=Massilia soli TaxID=2792854 RepID=A0ABS7SL49_9BURK|nr:hypothetical protein [Massilia soli]MBZ2206536.1 hypothetical protein [Massilia soli]